MLFYAFLSSIMAKFMTLFILLVFCVMFWDGTGANFFPPVVSKIGGDSSWDLTVAGRLWKVRYSWSHFLSLFRDAFGYNIGQISGEFPPDEFITRSELQMAGGRWNTPSFYFIQKGLTFTDYQQQPLDCALYVLIVWFRLRCTISILIGYARTLRGRRGVAGHT